MLEVKIFLARIIARVFRSPRIVVGRTPISTIVVEGGTVYEDFDLDF